ncbi:hypothetical protein CDD83_6908 [Cordyceps sp. RAO-2017]|nr:hypothetical protein CDD83_6908 [Cordyceps sp. RAO-2017]
MPTTRRSTGGARARPGPTRGQSTISFTGRVTKSVPRDGRKAVVVLPPAKPESEAAAAEDDHVEFESDVEPAPKEAEKKSEAELRAEGISDAQIGRYWRSLERQRKAPRVHQQDLDVSQKVLRYFDVSSQYGPCIGMSRTKRWLRAERLGLNPPIEVLAALLKDGQAGRRAMETTQMDEILNSITVST